MGQAFFLVKIMANEIKMIASFPPITGAIKLDGQGDGARLSIDIPRTEIKKVPKLYGLMGNVFEVIFKPIKDK